MSFKRAWAIFLRYFYIAAKFDQVADLIYWPAIDIFLWGMTVIMDSPQFSTLVAQTAPKESTGTALTIVNCIGFSITIVSIQLLGQMANLLEVRYLFLLLVPGPVIGVIVLTKSRLSN